MSAAEPFCTAKLSKVKQRSCGADFPLMFTCHICVDCFPGDKWGNKSSSAHSRLQITAEVLLELQSSMAFIKVIRK